MKQKLIAFIGAGNMARSLIAGLIKDGYPADKIIASNPSPEKLAALKKQYQIQTTQDNKQAVEQADIVVLAVKPNTVIEVCQEIAAQINERKSLLLSIVTGIRIPALAANFEKGIAIVRCMPNTPAMISVGATGLFANEVATTEQREHAEAIMRAVGITEWLDNESEIDVVAALSGSGPAYFFLIMESLIDAAVKQGLSKQQAHLLTLQTALGAASIAMQSEVDLKDLRQQVTSPGGTTEKAIEALEQGNIRALMSSALEAARERAEELAEMFNKK